jgi:hypothetical protein
MLEHPMVFALNIIVILQIWLLNAADRTRTIAR